MQRRPKRSNGMAILPRALSDEEFQPFYALGSNFVSGSNCRGLRIEGNVVWGSRYPIWIGGCTDLLVRNNTFANTRITSRVRANNWLAAQTSRSAPLQTSGR
jgi:hypothetical protein